MTTAAVQTRPKPPPPSRRIVPTPPLTQAVGENFLEIASTVGGMGMLAARILARALTFRLDGAELMRNLYKMGVKSMPIVVVTGHPSPRAVGELEHWAVPLLAKPVNLPHLEALITRSLGASGAA